MRHITSARRQVARCSAKANRNRDAILRARERDYARYGISDERRAVLYMIQNNGGRATPVGIARDLFRELHSVTELPERMEKDGLVKRYKGTGRSKIEVVADILFKLRGEVLQDLGIPEWQLNFPPNPQLPAEQLDG